MDIHKKSRSSSPNRRHAPLVKAQRRQAAGSGGCEAFPRLWADVARIPGEEAFAGTCQGSWAGREGGLHFSALVRAESCTATFCCAGGSLQYRMSVAAWDLRKLRGDTPGPKSLRVEAACGTAQAPSPAPVSTKRVPLRRDEMSLSAKLFGAGIPQRIYSLRCHLLLSPELTGACAVTLPPTSACSSWEDPRAGG